MSIRHPCIEFVLENHLVILPDDFPFVLFILQIINQEDIRFLTCGLNSQSGTAIVKVIRPIDIRRLGFDDQRGSVYGLCLHQKSNSHSAAGFGHDDLIFGRA